MRRIPYLNDRMPKALDRYSDGRSAECPLSSFAGIALVTTMPSTVLTAEACTASQCIHVRISVNSGTGVAALVAPVVKDPGHGVSLFDAKASHQTDRLTDMVQAWQRWWRRRSRFSTWCTPHASRWRTWRAGNPASTTTSMTFIQEVALASMPAASHASGMPVHVVEQLTSRNSASQIILSRPAIRYPRRYGEKPLEWPVHVVEQLTARNTAILTAIEEQIGAMPPGQFHPLGTLSGLKDPGTPCCPKPAVPNLSGMDSRCSTALTFQVSADGC